MLNINEINEAITNLENGPTTYDSCSKLASLYIVRRELSNSSNPVVVELQEILPQYKRYCAVKRKYQMQEATEEAVYTSMQYLCDEIVEFLHTLYSHTDTRLERSMLRDMLIELSNEKWGE